MGKRSRRQRQLKPLEDPQSARAVDNTRGSTLWAYNHYRSNVLTSLLNDITDLENEGLEEEYCSIMRRSLDYFVNSTTELPSGGFLTGNLHGEVAKFGTLYREWNDINGRGEDKVRERRKYLVKLRKQRQKISNKVRSIQYELTNELDQKVLSSTYAAIGELIGLVPNLLKNLASSYSDYLKRGGLTAA